MIAAPRSGSGKAMVTCGLLALLKRKEYNPAAFKCRPDYIDSLFHHRVLGVEDGNLDSFFETGTHMKQRLSRGVERRFIVAEGVTGYFDSLGGVSVQGSSFEIGSTLGLPTTLMVDGRGASLSLMVLIQGFLEYDAMLEEKDGEKTHNRTDCDAECVAGMQYEGCRKRRWKENEENYREERPHTSNGLHGCVYGDTDCHESKGKKNSSTKEIFFNRMSPMIYNCIKPMIEELSRIPVIGHLPELNFLHVGSRHLGLMFPDEIDGIREQLEQLAGRMDENLEWEPLLEIAAEAGGRDREVPVREEAGARQ